MELFNKYTLYVALALTIPPSITTGVQSIKDMVIAKELTKQVELEYGLQRMYLKKIEEIITQKSLDQLLQQPKKYQEINPPQNELELSCELSL